MPKDKIGDVKVMNNEYDNEKFFEEYAKMSRSKEGLKAAGEWHQLKPLFPSLEGKSVLDLGCGYGWHCKFAEEQGATKILGIDLSKKMIEEAQKRNSGNQIEYRISGLEEYDYPENEWDCVISNLALHYINSYHSQLKRFMRGFNGVSTKYLNNYLVWNNLVNYAKESDMEKRNIFLTFVLATLKTAKCRDLSNRPAVPLVA